MDVKIGFTYRTPKGTSTYMQSDDMTVEKALLIAEDLKKTGRMNDLTFVDSNDTTWNEKELKNFVKEVETEPHNIKLYFDGGFDKQSKRAGLGCAIYYEQNKKCYRLRKNALVEEMKTNNEAEYAALHLALHELDMLGVKHLPITIIGDSQVVINQLNGEWPSYEEDLSKWADRIENRMKKLGVTPHYNLVSRKENREADQLATQALNDIEIMSTVEINL
ncbi:ribonuclease H family protein [Salirhabdus sp. Marseille-P4669]|uniref:ribonuclease H family protein n=1 Tax=Salirhabdus sp. Marseille-P4669 TaxID=2042310 RepID=UPI000C7B206C|nr:ribonuclease H family protein [Salirhabdus sp. Marseille-P4669]